MRKGRRRRQGQEEGEGGREGYQEKEGTKLVKRQRKREQRTENRERKEEKGESKKNMCKDTVPHSEILQLTTTHCHITTNLRNIHVYVLQRLGDNFQSSYPPTTTYY